MTTTRWLTPALTAALLATAGCGGTSATPPASGQAALPGRQLAASEDSGLAALVAQLPAQISEQDAAGLLVQIDPGQIKNETAPGFQVADSDGDQTAQSRSGWSDGATASATRLSYYPVGSYYFPYLYNGGNFYPFTILDNRYDKYDLPYYFRSGGSYYPYTYYNYGRSWPRAHGYLYGGYGYGGYGYGGYGYGSYGAQVGQTTVRIRNYAYEPSTITVPRNGTVTFVNMDPVTHTATADGGSWDTGDIASGASATVTFTNPGTFRFHCEYHPAMRGTIAVR